MRLAENGTRISRTESAHEFERSPHRRAEVCVHCGKGRSVHEVEVKITLGCGHTIKSSTIARQRLLKSLTDFGCPACVIAKYEAGELGEVVRESGDARTSL